MFLPRARYAAMGGENNQDKLAEGEADMKSFFAGLAAAFVGFFIWVTVSVIYGVEAGLTGERSSPPAAFRWIATPAFLLMVGGPLWFWLIGPLWSRLKRKREP